MSNKKYIKRNNSLSSIKGYTLSTNTATVYPDFSFDAVINLINNDPVARGAVNHFVDKCMDGDYTILDRDTRKVNQGEKLRLDEKYKFRTDIIRKNFLMGKLFNNVYVEKVSNGTETKSLNILDSNNIDPITKPNGDPISFIGKIPNPVTGEIPSWSKDDITWIKYGDRSVGMAPVDMRALWENLVSKDYINRYISWLWKTGQYKLLYNFKNSSDNDINDFLVYLSKHDSDFKTPLIAKGEFEAKILRDIKETDSIIKLLDYKDSQTLILLRIPPIDAGIPDASGRSNADAQSNNLVTHVNGWKKVFSDSVNFDLFPKINKGNSLLVFGPSDRFHEKQIFETVQIMQSINMTNEAMQEYLEEKGIFWKSTLFNKIEEQPMSDNPRDKDTMPSRTGDGETPKQKSHGSGEASTTRQKQVKE